MRNNERVRLIEGILLLIIVGLPVFLVTFGLYHLFSYLQEKVFIGAGDIAIIPDEYTQICFIIIGVLSFMLIYSRHDFGVYDGKITYWYRKIRPLYIILFSSFIFIATLVYFFNSNSIISTHGIRDNNIILSTSNYSWNDFQDGTIYNINERIRKHLYKYKLHYELYTKDKKAYDIRKARHFWGKVLVINNLVEKNNIKLDRSQLDFEDAVSLLVDDYDSTDLDKGIKILKEIKLFTGDMPPESPYTQLMKEILK